MKQTTRPAMLLASVSLLLAAALSLGAGSGGTIAFSFAESFEDDVVGAKPVGLAGPMDPVIDTEFGEIFTKWPIDPRAIVQVVQVPGASGPNKVLRISDALIQDGTAHSEVTMRPVGAHGSVTVRFELRVVDLAGDSMRLTIVDNRTTPGTGRLAGLTIRPDGKVLAGSMPLPLVLKPGDFYRFAYVFELAGSADTYSLSIHPAAGTGAGGVELKDVPIPVDSVTVTDMTFTMSNEGTGAVELDNVRVLNSF